MAKLRKENQSLQIKLQFESRNNAVLMKNLTKIRANYFNTNGQGSPRVNTEVI